MRIIVFGGMLGYPPPPATVGLQHLGDLLVGFWVCGFRVGFGVKKEWPPYEKDPERNHVLQK